jgi:hypothetical protein
MWKAGTRWAVLGAVAGVLAVGAVAFGSMAVSGGKHSVAATPTPSAGGSAANGQRGQLGQMADQFLNDLAANLHIDRNTLDNALKTTANQEVDNAVKSGKLTQQQADMIKQNIANGKVPFFGPGLGRFEGAGAMSAIGGCTQNLQNAVTQALGGETPDQVRADLRSGKTFDQILAAHNTNAQALGTSVATAIQPCLDQAVTAGTLTSQKEQDILNNLKSGNVPFFGAGRHGLGKPGASPTPTTH